mgnify:CR=1 FL=1
MNAIETRMTQFLQSQSQFIGKGFTKGSLYDIGSFPGMVYDEEASGQVYGQVFQLMEAQKVWDVLDPYEMIDPNRLDKNMYRRQLCEVQVEDKTYTCHTYHFQLSTEGFRQILSGDYLAYLNAKPNRHQDFINKFKD